MKKPVFKRNVDVPVIPFRGVGAHSKNESMRKFIDLEKNRDNYKTVLTKPNDVDLNRIYTFRNPSAGEISRSYVLPAQPSLGLQDPNEGFASCEEGKVVINNTIKENTETMKEKSIEKTKGEFFITKS